MNEKPQEKRPAFKFFEVLLDIAVKDEPDFDKIYSKVRDKSLAFDDYLGVVALENAYLENNKTEILNSEQRVNGIIESFGGKWKAPYEEGGYSSTTRNTFATTITDFDDLVAERDIERNRNLRIIALLNAALTQCTLLIEHSYSHPLDITDEFRKTIAELKGSVAKIADKIASLDEQLNVKRKKEKK